MLVKNGGLLNLGKSFINGKIIKNWLVVFRHPSEK